MRTVMSITKHQKSENKNKKMYTNCIHFLVVWIGNYFPFGLFFTKFSILRSSSTVIPTMSITEIFWILHRLAISSFFTFLYRSTNRPLSQLPFVIHRILFPRSLSILSMIVDLSSISLGSPQKVAFVSIDLEDHFCASPILGVMIPVRLCLGLFIRLIMSL